MFGLAGPAAMAAADDSIGESGHAALAPGVDALRAQIQELGNHGITLPAVTDLLRTLQADDPASPPTAQVQAAVEEVQTARKQLGTVTTNTPADPPPAQLKQITVLALLNALFGLLAQTVEIPVITPLKP
ncbi:hypothetical protein A8W25_28735 [Streptomyces sp. ERV7]|nr:hypothetical protein A8W25_28735 [Streptomyces sp. ERV7]